MRTGRSGSRTRPWGDNIDQEIFNSLIPAELQNKDLTQDISRLEFCAVAVQLYEQMGGKQLNAADLTTPLHRHRGPTWWPRPMPWASPTAWAPDKFAPYTDISREQLATMLTRVYKALSLPGWTLATDDQYHLDYSGTKIFDDDGDISPYAKPSVVLHGEERGHQGDLAHHLLPPQRHPGPGGHRLRQRLPGAGP